MGTMRSCGGITRKNSGMPQESSPEYTHVERPFIEHLQRLGWDYLPGDTGVPYLTDRESFRQVPFVQRFREALRRINLDQGGQPWLDDACLIQAMSHLQRLGQPKLMAANKEATRLLIKGTTWLNILCLTRFERVSRARPRIHDPVGKFDLQARPAMKSPVYGAAPHNWG